MAKKFDPKFAPKNWKLNSSATESKMEKIRVRLDDHLKYRSPQFKADVTAFLAQWADQQPEGFLRDSEGALISAAIVAVAIRSSTKGASA